MTKYYFIRILSITVTLTLRVWAVCTKKGGVEGILEEIVALCWVGSVWQHHPRHPEGAADAQVCGGDRRACHHLQTYNNHITGRKTQS